MTVGKLEYAVRKAQERFDEWNDTSGIFTKHSGYYYEALATITDAVKIGIFTELGIEIEYDENGDLLEPKI